MLGSVVTVMSKSPIASVEHFYLQSGVLTDKSSTTETQALPYVK